MLAKFLSCAILFTIAVASQPAGTFHPPKAKSFMNIDFFVGWPQNATTPNGPVSITPNAAGTISGEFTGRIVENTTASVERFLPDGTGPAVYSEYINELLFANDEDETIMAKMTGMATYANGGLHGFSLVRLETTIPRLSRINTAMFVGEWVGATNSGTGNAKVEIFQICTGGRTNGERILAVDGTACDS